MRTDAALDRHVEQLFSLASTGRLLTATMDIRKMCEIVLTYATDATKSEVGLIALRDETGKRWEIMSQRGYSDDALRQTDLLLSQQLLPNGQPFRSDDVQQVKDYTAVIPATHSLLLMPILRGKEMVGVIRLESPNRDAFSEEDSYFVGQLANQAVISFDNMRLFQRITEARDRLQVLLNAMEEAILLIDSTGIVALANPRVKLIGLEPSKLVGQSIDALLSQKDLTFAAQLGFIENPEELRELVSSLQAHTWRETTPVTYSVSGDGTLHIQRQIIPVRDEKGEAIGILMVFYNKTEEQHLTEAREQLSQMIVHDLRSPLTAVTTSLKLLRELVPTDSDFRSVVMTTTDASQRAIRKLLTRVDSLLDIAKMESGQLTLDTEPTELATLADSVCVELSPLAHELEVEVTSEIDESLPLLDIDADKVERMLLNLVDNALKYTPADSRVTIRAFPPGKNGAPDDFVRIDVADRGPGVPEDYKTRLFDRYVQIEGRQKVRRGVGLGLTFCRLVAEAHGGRIWIEDNPGGGSIFSLTLPIIREDLLSLDKPETPAIDGKSTADDAAQKHDLRFKDPS
jgi:signal transduction histidine kinase